MINWKENSRVVIEDIVPGREGLDRTMKNMNV
jgi:hypothetical protein